MTAVTLETVLQKITNNIAARSDRGHPADYIPQLAAADLSRFGIAVATAEGDLVACGDHETPFSIQSISKVFTLTLALGQIGDALWQRVGREPSGNPFINAGAIAVTDAIVAGHQPKEALGTILRFIHFVSDDDTITIDHDVAASEKETGFRNMALANYMRAFGNLDNPVDFTLGVYFHHCAIAMSCRQLAKAGRYLAFGGRLSPTGPQVVSPERARRINALMLTCGHYDGSGEFAFRVGLPGKSGVGGGILAIVPDKASIAAWSPGLDHNGNSWLATAALEELSREMGWSVF